MGNITLAMIKPDAVKDGHTGKIVDMMIEAGFRVKAMKLTRLTQDTAGKFYEVHKERPFYSNLVSYMNKGAIVALILEKDNAVEDYRKLIGATDPANAEEGTIRCQCFLHIIKAFGHLNIAEILHSKLHNKIITFNRFG